MAYSNLPQILALSKSSADAGLEIERFPKLGGKLAQIDKEGVDQFNREVEQWVEKLMAAVEKALTESVKGTP